MTARYAEVRHGYTLGQIDKLVRVGVLRNSWYYACDADERYAAGWHAAVELLYTADVPPLPRDLVHAAWYAADRVTLRAQEQRGVPRSRGEAYTGRDDYPRFHAYWNTISRHTGSPEEPIVERLALEQILPRLSEAHRGALHALAAEGDYQAAADALGLTYNTFCTQVRKARLHFARLWLEGETPGGRWRDRRKGQENARNLGGHIRRRARLAKAAV